MMRLFSELRSTNEPDERTERSPDREVVAGEDCRDSTALDDCQDTSVSEDCSRPLDDCRRSSASELCGECLVLGYPSAEEPVIAGQSVDAEPGAVTALVGPNGSGKSTLLRGLANQLAPDEGSVLLDGREIHSLGSKELARKLGMLSQERASPEGITVEELVFHGRYPHRGFFEHVTAADRAAVEQALDLAGCTHLRERELGSLSGGQKQLAWIAMAIAQDTDVLLLDEPTTFLDLHHQLEVLEIVETLRDEGVTIVVVLHDVEQAARLADRVVALKDGEIQACGPPETVVTEELLAEVFRVDAEVEYTDRGPRVTPIRARHEDEPYGPDGDDDDVAGSRGDEGADEAADRRTDRVVAGD